VVEVTTDNAGEAARIQKAFLAGFDPGEVKFKPGKVSGNRALALAYIDARLVMDRLDEAVGIGGWKDEYTVLAGGTEVECRLSVRIGPDWVTKADVGGESAQPDGGDRMKAAYSDALKRAAVKFGIGRFLYRTANAWHDFNPQTKQFAHPLAITADGRIVAAPPAPAQRQTQQIHQDRQQRAATMPADGKELDNRLRTHEAKLVSEGVCKPGELIAHVLAVGVANQYVADIARWSSLPAIEFAVEAVKGFEAARRRKPAAAK
jgi:hypothetical protein